MSRSSEYRRPPAKKSRTTMNIDREKLTRARRVLGTKTDTEAVDRALDLIVGNAEIESAIDQVFGQFPDFKVS